jgi:hypothetical protein
MQLSAHFNNYAAHYFFNGLLKECNFKVKKSELIMSIRLLCMHTNKSIKITMRQSDTQYYIYSTFLQSYNCLKLKSVTTSVRNNVKHKTCNSVAAL